LILTPVADRSAPGKSLTNSLALRAEPGNVCSRSFSLINEAFSPESQRNFRRAAFHNDRIGDSPTFSSIFHRTVVAAIETNVFAPPQLESFDLDGNLNELAERSKGEEAITIVSVWRNSPDDVP